MATITFKVSDDEAYRIRQRAQQEHLSLSEYLRRRAGGTAQNGPLRKIRCDISGVEIFAPLNYSPALTTETVRHMLADFP